jgi:hypothetical protein
LGRLSAEKTAFAIELSVAPALPAAMADGAVDALVRDSTLQSRGL